MNALGNLNVAKNMRILLINNGLGAEFHMPYSATTLFGKKVDPNITALGHYRIRQDAGKNERQLSAAAVWSIAMGFDYLKAESKEDFETVVDCFVSEESDNPIILECFTTSEGDELAAQKLARLNPKAMAAQRKTQLVKRLLPDSLIQAAKKLVKD
jgi:2-succinyl-5-enolpyruvyl-6-hydroxy-3-cyclohexene-1-carboxylate synthase